MVIFNKSHGSGDIEICDYCLCLTSIMEIVTLIKKSNATILPGTMYLMSL